MNLIKLFRKRREPLNRSLTQDVFHEYPKKQSDEHKEPIYPSLLESGNRLKDIFSGCQDFIFLPWHYGANLQYSAMAVYCLSLVQEKKVNYFKTIMQDLVPHCVGPAANVTPEDVFNYFENHGASSETAHIIGDLDTAVRDILGGNVVVLFDQWDKALSFKAITIQERQVMENLTEPVVRGPHESTVENLMKNIGLLRNRLKTPDFKLNFLTAGGKSQSEIAYGYIEGAVNPETLAEFQKRIMQVKEMEILETSYIEELLEDSRYTPFPQVRITERPDTAVAALLDGKIFVMVSGSPSILICPGLFMEFMQSPEDYYQRTVFSSMIRLLRFTSFSLTVVLPAIYIALTTFHPELIPTVLLLTILNTREGIPFPALLEALIMNFFLEILTEAGVRLPRPVGSAVSIVGALVIGQAAIDAGIASPAMVVVVSLTAIANFALPQYNFSLTVRLLRIPLMLLASILGVFGLMIGFLWIMLHLMSLRSLGQPYMAPIGPTRPRQFRDVFVRMPMDILLRSPRNRQRHYSSALTKEEG
ncbi:spore germination protein [Paenibacillus allorhizosphaerae]|uniref:Spore germination protein n=1 Tax=Paenibacillus allorhizosphaerae TaxID=2849866 RepID=A0ABM8VQK7_9BACL|nr:spore germination protein [Paenibacillus allorhizosphaerae]CAG7654272.1 hypothetical protein PAECIP111802_05722 [Paenibacillus allorhizosphaerae]